MAYATLLSLTETLEFILNSHDDQSQILHQTGQQKLLRSLYEKFSFLLSFMEEDFTHTQSETMSRLERKIREMAYKAVHTIESQVSDGLHFKSEDLQQIIEQVDSISEEVVSVKMEDLNVIKNHPPTKFSPVGSSKSDHVNKSPIVGFKDELMAIKERLFTTPSELAIISIVGMGGIGKTTLARTIFDDSKIVTRFDARGWLTVSQTYDAQDMLGRLLKSIQRNESNQGEAKDLGERLYKNLKQKRYLVVIDDMWDIKAWDSVRRFFPHDETGSRIILTTRLLDVAVDADSSSPIYRLSLLNLDDSWKLLHQTVFKEESCPLELEEVGKEIAQNCKGLPLALVLIGGLLTRGEKKLDYWTYIRQNINSALVDADNEFMEILALSYYHLPYQLRACFLYMGVFPEDYEVPKSELIKLWVAEGFVKSHTSKSLEEVARAYLQDLIDRNMILVCEWNSIGGIKSCGIHDLVQDLCARITEEEKFLRVVHKQVERLPRQRLKNGYHVSIPSDNNPDYGSQSRSLLCLTRTTKIDPLLSFIISFQQPRVLYSRVPLTQLPFDIVNLRFLALTLWEDFNLNASIFKLLHLQTLIIHSRDTITLPVEIWNMPRLRHIFTKRCLFPFPSGSQNGDTFILSKNLQTLKGVIDSSSTKDVLQLMPNLKKLKIIFNKVTCMKLSSYVSEYFVHLHGLEDLSCIFGVIFHNDIRQPLVEDIRIPSSLRKLTLDCCTLSSKTMATIGSLPDLQVLKLKECNFVKKVWGPIEGEFSQLKLLLLYSTNLKHFKADEMSFPSLECLRFSYCFELKRIPLSIGDIPTLQLIEVYYSGRYVEKSAVLIRREQEDMGNENLKIIITPELDEDGEEEDTDDDDDIEEDEDDDGKDEEEDVDSKNDNGKYQDDDDDNEEDEEDDDNENWEPRRTKLEKLRTRRIMKRTT